MEAEVMHEMEQELVEHDSESFENILLTEFEEAMKEEIKREDALFMQSSDETQCHDQRQNRGSSSVGEGHCNDLFKGDSI